MLDWSSVIRGANRAIFFPGLFFIRSLIFAHFCWFGSRGLGDGVLDRAFGVGVFSR